MNRVILRRVIQSIAATSILALAISGCTSGGADKKAAEVAPGKASDTATFALPSNTSVNWIWPFASFANFSLVNAAYFQVLMYRPLYWFGTATGAPAVNPTLSLADLPTVSNGGRTFTLHLKDYKWSNGESLTSQDVVFWFNMEKAEKKNWAAYVPGQFPDNVTSVGTPDQKTVTFTTDKPYSANWFLQNQLSQITPMPLAWDMTSDTAKGTCATASSGCAAVYSYLNGQAKDLKSYATSKLWSVVDGPWRLSAFNSDGHVTLIPNRAYTGPVKAKLKQFKLVPFTTSAAEFNVLRPGSTIDVGYIPAEDIAQPKSASSSPVSAGPNPLRNYTLAPWFLYGIDYFPYNFNNPTTGPIFSQLYFRQAFQSIVDQQGMLKTTAKNYGVGTTGPIPLYPSNSPLLSATERHNPYPFSVANARRYLTSNGWAVHPGGATVCTSPGSGPGQCGAGIKQGQSLTFTLHYASGTKSLDDSMKILKSDASQAGITLNLATKPFNSIIGEAIPSNKTWELDNWGGGWVYVPDYYPSGELLFQTGSGSNAGAYSSKSSDTLIIKTTTTSGVGPMQTYEDDLARNLPVVWTPNYTYSLTEVATALKGVTPQNPYGALTPENWHY